MSQPAAGGAVSPMGLPMDLPAANQIIKRTLLVNINGSLANLAMAGPQAAMWKPIAGKETELFYPQLGSSADPTEAVNSIRAGVIRGVTIKEHMSTYPVTLGVSLNCVPPSEVTDLGEKYAYTVLPHSRISAPQKIYECNPSLQEDAMWRQKYSQYNESNLESQGVMDVVGHPYVFLHEEHPAIGLLRHNEEMIGCDIDKQPRMEKVWIKVSRQVLNTCCQTLRQKVLAKMAPIKDMNMFSIQLHRLNADGWDDLGSGVEALSGFSPKLEWSAEQHDEYKKTYLKQFVTTPYQYIARLEVEYEIPCAAKAA